MIYIVQAIILGLVWRACTKGIVSGLALAAFFLAWLPHGLRVEVPGPVPEFTIHRSILLVVLACGSWQQAFRQRLSTIPFFGLIVLALSLQSIACVFALDSALSFKRLFATIFENFLFFVLLALVPKTPADAVRILAWAVAGLTVAAALSCAQYYGIADPIHALLPHHPYGDRGGVAGIYQHRIHQGYAMAMGLPVALALLPFFSGTKRIALFGCVLLLAAGTYFGGSRGPWVTAALAILLVTLLGPISLKKAALAFVLAGSLVCAVRPGIRSVVIQRVDSLFVQDDGSQNASAEYRKILWRVATTELAKSPLAMLFGYGGMSTTLLDISGYFDSGRGGQVMDQGFSSWDSEWAAHLVQYGWLGLFSEILLRSAFAFALLKGCWRSSSPQVRGLLTGILAGTMVYNFAMLGVAMFSPQLKYTFCAMLGCAVIFFRTTKTHDHHRTVAPARSWQGHSSSHPKAAV